MKDHVLLGFRSSPCRIMVNLCLFYQCQLARLKCPLLVMVRVLGKSEATDKLNKFLICSLVAVHELEYSFAPDITSFLIKE